MDQVDEVKQKTDIVSLIGSKIKLTKAGKNYKGLCPFHSEKTPSFMVSPELQIYKCFGCGESGDSITFLEKYDNLDFVEALESLASRVGITLQPFRQGEQGEKQKLWDLNSLVSKFYNYILINHKLGKKALSYLTRERGLKLSTVKKFNLGYSPAKSEILTNFLIKKKKYQPEFLVNAGLLYKTPGLLIDRFKDRIIFPLYDHRGMVVGFAGRLLPDSKSTSGKYINTPETQVYHKSKVLYGLNITKEDIKKEGFAVVVEGELDVISGWQSGVTNMVAIKGSSLTSEQVNLLSRYCKKLILALDSDVAGGIAAKRGAELASGFDIDVSVAVLKDYKDPDEAARKNPGAFKNTIKNSIGAWDYLLDIPFDKYPDKTGESAQRISRQVIPILASIRDKIVQAHYVELVANKLKIPSQAVYDQLSSVKTELPVKEKDLVVSVERTRRELLEHELLSLIFQSDPKIALRENYLKYITLPLYKRILEQLLTYLGKNSKYVPDLFLKSLPVELRGGYSDLLLSDYAKILENPDLLNRELNVVSNELNLMDLRKKMEELTKRIKEEERVGNKVKLKRLQTNFTIVSAKLTSLKKKALEV